MSKIAFALVAIVALLHTGFLVLEMFYWDHDLGRKVFKTTPEFSAESATLAMQQGLYNGFLVAGLIWGLLAGRKDVKIFFLLCVITAGVFGGLTASTTILYVQALPAVAALLFVMRG